jgi:hypothetical protein
MELSLFSSTSEEPSPEHLRASPTRVLTVPLSEKIGVALGLPISAYAFLALFFLPPSGSSIPVRIGLFSAFICSWVSFIFCWSAVFAYVIRRFNLRPVWSGRVAMPFLLVGILFLSSRWLAPWLDSVRLGDAVMFFLTSMYIKQYCSKLAYPTLISKLP